MKYSLISQVNRLWLVSLECSGLQFHFKSSLLFYKLVHDENKTSFLIQESFLECSGLQSQPC